MDIKKGKCENTCKVKHKIICIPLLYVICIKAYGWLSDASYIQYVTLFSVIPEKVLSETKTFLH